MEYVLNHGMESSHRINNIQAKAEHTEQVKIENTELRLRVNDLETQLHDIQLKYEETKSRERNFGFKSFKDSCRTIKIFQFRPRFRRLNRTFDLELDFYGV